MSDNEVRSADEEETFDAAAHERMLNSINNLTGSRFIRKATRTEPSVQQSEFHLAKSGNHSKVQLNDVIGVLRKSKRDKDAVNQLEQLQKKIRVLEKPVENPVACRVQRSTLYEKTKKDLALWEPVVTATAVAAQTVFPLQYGSVKINNAPPEKLSQYRVKTDLMTAMEALERKYAPTNGGGNEEEPKNDYSLTLEELREQRMEAARRKIRESYKIAKGRRLNKIKSKKYHRLLKKDKLKEQLKKFEEMKDKDPEEALKQLQQLEKQRFQERVSLRHKNTGTWAQNLQVRSKYNMEVRRELSEQLAIGKQLTAKRLQENSESSDDEEEIRVNQDEDNPWVKLGDHEKDAKQELTSGYKKYWEERNRAIELRQKKKKEPEVPLQEEQPPPQDDAEDDREDEEKKLKAIKKKIAKKSKVKLTTDCPVEHVIPKKKAKGKKKVDVSVEDMFQRAEELIQDKFEEKLAKVNALGKEKQKGRKRKAHNSETKSKAGDLSFKQQPRLADADIELNEVAPGPPVPEAITKQSASTLSGVADAPSTKSVDINPKEFIQMKPKHLLTALPDMATAASDDDDGEDDRAERQRLTIAEAFEDDDIVADFLKEKEDERDKDRPKDIELSLPGWGSWVGPGMDRAKTQQKRKIFKVPEQLPRRDDNREKVIINEKAINNAELGKHLVNEVPFPYLTVKDYEASIRTPLGRTFIPETAHSAMIEPRVVTQLGAVIEPMKKEILRKKASDHHNVRRAIYNGAVQKYKEFLRTPFDE